MKTLKFTLIAIFGIISFTSYADDKLNNELKPAKIISVPEMNWGSPDELEEKQNTSANSVIQIEMPEMVWGNAQDIEENIKLNLLSFPETNWGSLAELDELTFLK